MNETKLSIGKRIGYFFLSLVPMIIALVVSNGIAIVLMIPQMIIKMLEGDLNSMADYIDFAAECGMQAGVLYSITLIAVFGCWYYFGCKRKQIAPPKPVRKPTTIIFIIVLAFCLQYVTNYLVLGIDAVMPRAMEAYEELMELAGIGEFTLLSILYTAILGPIVEEFTFRGMTLYFAEKSVKRFWIANIWQALLFGVFHLNVVQGIYAFCLGIVMGWLYKQFRSLYVPILFHIAFNSLSFGMEAFDHPLPDHMVFVVIWAIFMCAITVLLMLGLWKNAKAKQKGQEISCQE